MQTRDEDSVLGDQDPVFALQVGPVACWCLCEPLGKTDEPKQFDEFAPLPDAAARNETVDRVPSASNTFQPQQVPGGGGGWSASASSSSPPGGNGAYGAGRSNAPGGAAARSNGGQNEVRGGDTDPDGISPHSSSRKQAMQAAQEKQRKRLEAEQAKPIRCANGCGVMLNPKETGISPDDPIQEHYKKTGLWGSIGGAFGDKKTMYCHHLTISNELAVRAAREAGQTFSSSKEVWAFLGKRPCQGRFAYDRGTGWLKCGGLERAGHDRTCNPETCLFIANGLPCPVSEEMLKAS